MFLQRIHFTCFMQFLFVYCQIFHSICNNFFTIFTLNNFNSKLAVCPSFDAAVIIIMQKTKQREKQQQINVNILVYNFVNIFRQTPFSKTPTLKDKPPYRHSYVYVCMYDVYKYTLLFFLNKI